MGEKFDFNFSLGYYLAMTRERGSTDPTEAYFNARFQELYRLGKEKNDYGELWRSGFSYIDNSFYLLANLETRETIPEMWMKGKLPKTLPVVSGANNMDGAVSAWQVSHFLTRIAVKMDGVDFSNFREWAKKLGIVEVDSLQLYKLRDPRKWWETAADGLAVVFEKIQNADLPWEGSSQEFYQYDRALRSRE